MNKVGRNSPCPCGSGKKYKKCCLDIDAPAIGAQRLRMPKEVMEHLFKRQEELKRLEQTGIYINYVRPTIYKGKKVWAVGSTVYYDRPPNETFHEFIIHFLRFSFGREWWEENVESEDAHFVMRCFLKFIEWRKKNASPENQNAKGIWSGLPDGWSRSLLALAFDIVTLEHTRELPEPLKARLRNKNEYQGVRFEIAIAAIFARLDCEINFIEEKAKKHCEFVAKHRPSGIEIAVEVKSRHRPGVIHTEGQATEEVLLKGDVGRLLRDALQQNPGDRPFMIFIDLNSPLTPNMEMREKPWFKDSFQTMDTYGAPTASNPDPYNAIFFTNYSFHYQTENEASSGEYLFVAPLYSKHMLPDGRFLNVLRAALDNYGNVPNLDLEDLGSFRQR